MNGGLSSEGNVTDQEKISVLQLITGAYFIEIKGVKKLKFLKK